MGAIISLAFAATLGFGPADLQGPMDLQGPVQVDGPKTRVVEGVFMKDHYDSAVRYFEAGADTPPNMERVATMTRSDVAGRVARVLPGQDNELRLVAERPDEYDLFFPEYEGQEVDDVVAVIDDEDGMPIAFVTSERDDVVGIVVHVADEGLYVVEQEPNSSMPIGLSHEDIVLGVITISPRGGVNALMDYVDPRDVGDLIQIFENTDEWQPGQN